jgi:hypothetical protein
MDASLGSTLQMGSAPCLPWSPFRPLKLFNPQPTTFGLRIHWGAKAVHSLKKFAKRLTFHSNLGLLPQPSS